MTCRACGAEIAANAIVCYRCGAATLAPAAAPAPSRRRSLWPVIVAAGLAAAAIAVVVFVLLRGR